MESQSVPLSLWRRGDEFDHSVPLGETLRKVVEDILEEYESATKSDRMSFVEDGDEVQPMEEEETAVEQPAAATAASDRESDDGDVSMASSILIDSSRSKNVRRNSSVSEESMSISCPDPDRGFDDDDDDDNDAKWHSCPENVNGDYSWRRVLRGGKDLDGEVVSGARRRGRRSTGFEPRCMRCEAYDAHCKAAAENYRRTLNSYTKTVSELMIGFKKVLERYPELRTDSSDRHLHYMAQAALGRNNLVQEMVRLAAERTIREADRATSNESDGGYSTDPAVISVHEALKTCYTDSEAVRMLLRRYAKLYVRYIEVWREMCCKVSKEITVMEFLNFTEDRPGISHEYPWCEARAYVARILGKVASVTPRAVGEACARGLKNIDFYLSAAPKDFERHKDVVNVAMDDVRARLDSNSQTWSWDSRMNDLYFDIRSDLTTLECLIGVGEISVKTLLHERAMLVSQVRKMTTDHGSLELQMAQTRSKLRETMSRCHRAEAEALW